MIDNKGDDFLVYKRREIQKYEHQIRDLQRENTKLKQLQHRLIELEVENIDLKTKLTQDTSNGQLGHDMAPKIGPMNGSDRHQVMEFMHIQEAPDVIPRVPVTPTRSHLNTTDSYNGLNTSDCLVTDLIGTPGDDEQESPTNTRNIGYGRGLRRPSVFHIPNRQSLDARQSPLMPDIGHQNQRKKRLNTAMIWSIGSTGADHSDTGSRHSAVAAGLQELAKHMRTSYGQTANHTVMHKILVSEWNRASGRVTRTEFFYHTLHVLVANGCLITTCQDHQPPCRPKVCNRLFESSAAPVLKSFVRCINGHKLMVIQVELLVALELLCYSEAKYRPAVGDLFDVLFRKGVVEAVAFSEWSVADSSSPADKQKLINEIKSSGFILLKRSPSV